MYGNREIEAEKQLKGDTGRQGGSPPNNATTGPSVSKTIQTGVPAEDNREIEAVRNGIFPEKYAVERVLRPVEPPVVLSVFGNPRDFLLSEDEETTFQE